MLILDGKTTLRHLKELLKSSSTLKTSRLLEVPSSLLQDQALQVPSKPPWSSSKPLEALQALSKHLQRSRFQVSSSLLKSRFSPLQFAFKLFQALEAPLHEASFKSSWRVPLKGPLLKTKSLSSLKSILSEGLWNLPGNEFVCNFKLINSHIWLLSSWLGKENKWCQPTIVKMRSVRILELEVLLSSANRETQTQFCKNEQRNTAKTETWTDTSEGFQILLGQCCMYEIARSFFSSCDFHERFVTNISQARLFFRLLACT